MDTSERWDSASEPAITAKSFLYAAFSVVALYLLAFAAIVFFPGIAGKLRTIGVDEALLTKVFYPVLYLIR